MRRRIHKGDHPNVANTLNNIGVTLHSLGRYEEALQYDKESLEMRRKIHKGDHPDVANTLNGIGVTLHSLGRYEEALQYDKESLEMRRKIHKGDHPDVANSLRGVGVTLHSLGRYEEALPYKQESLEIRRKIHKGDHPDMANSLRGVGVTLHSLGRYEEALTYKQESLEMRRRIHNKKAIALNEQSLEASKSKKSNSPEDFILIAEENKEMELAKEINSIELNVSNSRTVSELSGLMAAVSITAANDNMSSTLLATSPTNIQEDEARKLEAATVIQHSWRKYIQSRHQQAQTQGHDRAAS
jgi:tetratricopeptide (TPR) repeat protein